MFLGELCQFIAKSVGVMSYMIKYIKMNHNMIMIIIFKLYYIKNNHNTYVTDNNYLSLCVCVCVR